MTTLKTFFMLMVAAMLAVGCSQAEPKKNAELTPEQKAANEKAHEEMKKNTGGTTTPAPAK